MQRNQRTWIMYEQNVTKLAMKPSLFVVADLAEMLPPVTSALAGRWFQSGCALFLTNWSFLQILPTEVITLCVCVFAVNAANEGTCQQSRSEIKS